MINRPKREPNKLFSKAKKLIAAWSLFGALIASDPSFAQTGKDTNKTSNIEYVKKDTTNAINSFMDFALKNTEKYYPNTKEHLNIMLNSFRDQEHKDSTLTIIKDMIENISDSAQKVGATIYFLEMSVFRNGNFSATYDSKITDSTFSNVEKADRKYKDRFKIYYAKLESQTEQLKQEILKKQEELKWKQEELKQAEKEKQESEIILKEKQEELKNVLQELETTMAKFSPEDVKKNASIKKLTIETEAFYKEWWFAISSHLQSLFDASK